MKNMIELRDALSEVFDSLREGKLSNKDASELVNCTGKIINSVKVELEYYALRKEKPKIDFFE